LTLPDSSAAWHRRVWQLSWPVVTANATIPLVGLVDTAVMGRMPDAAFVGAVAVGATIFNALYWLFGFLRMGTTGLAAQALGAGNQIELTAVAVRSTGLALAIGLCAILLQLPLHTLMMWLFSASTDVEDLAGSYFLIRIWGAPALMVHMVVLGVLFGTQRMRATLWLSILLNMTNIALDLIFVLGLDWGVAGVAAATVISEWLAAAVGVVAVARALGGSSNLNRVLNRTALWRRDSLVRLFHISGNLIVRSFFVQLPFFVFTLIGASLGDLVLAANAIVMQIFLTMVFALDGPAHTAETLCGFAYGARDRTKLRQAMGFSLIWAVGLAVVLSFAVWLLGETFVGWLTLLPDVRAAAINLLPWAIAAPIVTVWAFHFDGVFIGTTQIVMLRNSMFLSAAVYLAVIWLGLDALGNQALWLAMMVFMGTRGVLLGLLYPRIEGNLDTQVQPSTD
jgi:MATE family multidrug resistance protein